MKKKVFLNMGVLALSNIIVRIIGMIYKVWLAKEISPVALGLHQLSMSVYSVFITPVASGLPNATSRLCAKYLKDNQEENVLASAVKIAFFPLVISLILMLLFPNLLARLFLHEDNAKIVILALIPAVTLGGLASLPQGLLHAKGKSYLSGIYEIIEQLFKILLAIILVRLFKNTSVEVQASLPNIAISLGGVLSFIMLFLTVKGVNLKKGGYSRELLENALPPTFARLGTSLLHLGTTTILPLCLISYGLTKESALSQYGILTSMAYPVVFAPMTVIGALCVVTLPEIAKNLNNKKIIIHKAKSSFLISLLITVLFSLLVLLFAPYLAKTFFKQEIAGRFMVMLIPSIIFLGLSQVARTVLNGLGKQKTLMVTSIVDGCFGFLLTFFLVTRFGIYGFILGNCIQDFLAFIINFILCFRAIKKG